MSAAASGNWFSLVIFFLNLFRTSTKTQSSHVSMRYISLLLKEFDFIEHFTLLFVSLTSDHKSGCQCISLFLLNCFTSCLVKLNFIFDSLSGVLISLVNPLNILKTLLTFHLLNLFSKQGLELFLGIGCGHLILLLFSNLQKLINFILFIDFLLLGYSMLVMLTLNRGSLFLLDDEQLLSPEFLLS